MTNESEQEFRYLGDFAVNYILEHQQELIIDVIKDWKEIAETVLTEFYKSVGKKHLNGLNTL